MPAAPLDGKPGPRAQFRVRPRGPRGAGTSPDGAVRGAKARGGRAGSWVLGSVERPVRDLALGAPATNAARAARAFEVDPRGRPGLPALFRSSVSRTGASASPCGRVPAAPGRRRSRRPTRILVAREARPPGGGPPIRRGARRRRAHTRGARRAQATRAGRDAPVEFRTRQREWVRSARALGVATMACVYSWDSLTNRRRCTRCPTASPSGTARRPGRRPSFTACRRLHRRYGGVAVRPLVRLAAVAPAGSILGAPRALGGAPGHPVRLLLAVHRRARARGRVRLAAGASLQRRIARGDGERRHPAPTAQQRPVGRGPACGSPRGGDLPAAWDRSGGRVRPNHYFDSIAHADAVVGSTRRRSSRP